jgi:hypothetical protein
MYGETEVHLHSILALALATLPMEKNTGIHQTGGWAVPRAGLDLSRKTKISFLSGMEAWIVQPTALWLL